MAAFPSLKSGAVAQYPSDRRRETSTQVFRFLDGSEQRFRGFGSSLRRWTIRLDLLDESEMVNLSQFFESVGGRAGIFAFTDPFDGTAYPNCSFGRDVLALTFGGESRGSATVMIREVPS
jgi:Conserved hypothetical protein 2217 (DUF2460)